MHKLPKLLIIGHGRHGKDTVCDILASRYNFNFLSSSQFCSRKFMFNDLKDKYGYQTEEECYIDRHNHRQEWYDNISLYCQDDPSRLGKEIFKEYDIYCGLRNKSEFFSMKNQKVFDYVIWVDRSDHLPIEDKSSMTLEMWMADYVIDNNGTLSELIRNVDHLMSNLLKNDQESNLPASTSI